MKTGRAVEKKNGKTKVKRTCKNISENTLFLKSYRVFFLNFRIVKLLRINQTPKVMTLDEIMQQLQQLGHESIKKVLVKHGAREPFFGVKVEDLKKIVKRVKTDYPLSLELYNTGNSDAMYLAGLIADPSKMTRQNLNQWVEKT